MRCRLISVSMLMVVVMGVIVTAQMHVWTQAMPVRLSYAGSPVRMRQALPQH
ncbi:hypothetical protein Enr13x_74950 [Stieleria neptunia]|uniref:Uncharacterized protein n=1 Tax=Stieleria neptunia TaxID=2527979 RepID=A0A518I3A7_9BACT|nr:hypothetical protein Enr13x_74950 [Stieleria neptunia]